MIKLVTTLTMALAVAFAALFALPASAVVNINTASKDELIALPGIGPSKAQAILDYRAQHGGFKSVDELKDVKGIGAKRFEKLRAEVSVSPLPRSAKGDAKADAKAGAANGAIRASAEPKGRR